MINAPTQILSTGRWRSLNYPLAHGGPENSVMFEFISLCSKMESILQSGQIQKLHKLLRNTYLIKITSNFENNYSMCSCHNFVQVEINLVKFLSQMSAIRIIIQIWLESSVLSAQSNNSFMKFQCLLSRIPPKDYIKVVLMEK